MMQKLDFHELFDFFTAKLANTFAQKVFWSMWAGYPIIKGRKSQIKYNLSKIGDEPFIILLSFLFLFILSFIEKTFVREPLK